MSGLYDPRFDRDSCGVGFVATTSGRSHTVLELALEAVANLTNRGAVSADGKTGDGAGVLTQIPYGLLAPELHRLGARITRHTDLGVGMFFLPQDPGPQARSRAMIEEAIIREGLVLFGWRKVPLATSALGHEAARTCPQIEQVLVGRPERLGSAEFERCLYLARKSVERGWHEEEIRDAYIPSFSHQTIVYKGLFTAPQLPRFYPDLEDPQFETAVAVFHQRYSTNTFPSWSLAQPFRFLAHNGEINTVWGNINWTRAREADLRARCWRERARELRPVIQPGGSDSAMLDNVLELIVRSGRDLLHAMMLLVPEAWENVADMPEDVRAFYEFHAGLSEPWDGPAALAFSDGRFAAAALDRNGLRPARYTVMDDGLVVVASEVGVVQLDPGRIVEKGRLGPGRMIAVDTAAGRILTNDAIKRERAWRRPYAAWISAGRVRLDEAEGSGAAAAAGEKSPGNDDTAGCGDDVLLRKLTVFGYSQEELQRILHPMWSDGKDPVWSMGDDTPLAVLSSRPRLVYQYIKQRFAQVTNPPIDPLRERLVMSLRTLVGGRPGFLEEGPEQARLVELESPLLTNAQLSHLRDVPGFEPRALPAVFPAGEGSEGLEWALVRLCDDAAYHVEEGAAVLILSDRTVDRHRAPIPMVLAVGAVHQELIRRGLRMRVSLVAETGEARDVHHLAALVGYGASAVNPYLVYEAIAREASRAGVEPSDALSNYRQTIESGLLKVMSKMGISTISSYHGAQIFEAVGLDHALVEFALTGTPSRLGGIGLAEIAEDVRDRHRKAFGETPPPSLGDPGLFRFRKDGEYHAFHPNVVRALHRLAVRGTDDDYLAYAWEVTHRPPTAIRDLLEFAPRSPVPVEDVEPAGTIVKRFVVSSMSHGSLSREAHETLAIAMNRLGAKSSSGEGGEDPGRYKPAPNGDWANCAVKQVASGRFGVTTAYLVAAQELEIKMAQGSKPGEGGQIPGTKVTEEIARIRRAQPGIALISPPPHHDIYSIEDLAQLIYDLKQGNPRARVSVKLVIEAGVGTVAAGVAKAYADTVHIAGCDGGTGASPLDSIKNAGIPWELGLAETQQTLVANNLRGRVRVRVDGGMKTAVDVVIAAMLGAEEFGFGSAAVVALVCVMARQCHLNSCPVGIATQRADLRAKFPGTPERVIQFFLAIAEDVRRILASLGFRAVAELVGRSDLLRVRGDVPLPRARRLVLDAILADPDPSGTRARRHIVERNDRPGEPFDDRVLVEIGEDLLAGRPVDRTLAIRNVDRAVGARIASAIARQCGDAGLPEGTITLRFTGSAGQSFGAWCVPGMRLHLTGEANDYVGKGMTGGEIAISPPDALREGSSRHVIAGNTVLYGATGGRLFAAGRTGERFAVRNSGAVAVVEGVGDHGCEYMTGGTVVVLGETGRNFGAGMTGGVAYVFDQAEVFEHLVNPTLVTLQRVTDPADIASLRDLIAAHAQATGSTRAGEILRDWDRLAPRFWKVLPRAVPVSAVTPHPPGARRRRG
jgi:glutamate synthase domain-containing protein 2/glutamate synthase domain-containing protein 1/glutamate synthase domain-containing protein 3